MKLAGMIVGLCLASGMARAEDFMQRARATRMVLPSRTASVPADTFAPSPARAAIDRGLPPSAIDRVTREHSDETRFCLARARSSGTVSLTLEIDETGRVVRAQATDHSRLGTCLERAARRWQFPPAGGATTAVLPFTFAPVP